MAKLVTEHGPFVNVMSSSSTVYVVPEYQRGYSWLPKKQVAELWSDILRLYRMRLANAEMTPHFIGSVVLGSAPTKAFASSECPVIDGQQRLTTLSLIIAAIRDELIDDAKQKKKLTSKYLANIDDDSFEIRLRLGVQDRVMYDAIISEETRPGKSNSVSRAYDFVVTQLRHGPAEESDPDDANEEDPEADESSDPSLEIDEVEVSGEIGEFEEDGEDFQDDLEFEDEDELTSDEADENEAAWDWSSLIEVIGTQLELVAISDVPPESAYQIFATLNSTGLKLAQLDLIRNAVFMLLPTTGQSVFKKHWVPMEKCMGKAWMEAYLHASVVRRGRNVPAKETYRSAVAELSRAGIVEKDVTKVVEEWHAGAWAYLLLAEPHGNLRATFATGKVPNVPKSLKDALARLRTWGTTPMEPVLLEMLERFRVGKLTAAQANKMLAELESFVVRRFIVGIPPNDLRSIFARLTQQVRKHSSAADFAAALHAGLREESRRWPSDAEVRESFTERALYRKPIRQCFFVLKRLAEDLEGKECPHIVHGTASSDFSIEHILPQNFTKAWQEDLHKWSDPDPLETWSKYRHTLGNLTLTAYNSELSDMQFRSLGADMDKVRWIRTSLRLKLSKSVLSKQKWTRTEIEARSSELADRALKIWSR